MSNEQKNNFSKIIFPTLPSTGEKEIVPQEVRLTQPPQAVMESASADIVRLDPPPRLTFNKEEGAVLTIGEVSRLLNLPAHVIRFWQTRFPQIKPIVRDDGRRYYHPDDVSFMRGLSRLLHEEGYTIKGVHRLVRKKGVDFVRDKSEGQLADFDDRFNQVLYGLVSDLEQLQTRVKKLVA